MIIELNDDDRATVIGALEVIHHAAELVLKTRAPVPLTFTGEGEDIEETVERLSSVLKRLRPN